jgi:hypothetical protein
MGVEYLLSLRNELRFVCETACEIRLVAAPFTDTREGCASSNEHNTRMLFDLIYDILGRSPQGQKQIINFWRILLMYGLFTATMNQHPPVHHEGWMISD